MEEFQHIINLKQVLYIGLIRLANTLQNNEWKGRFYEKVSMSLLGYYTLQNTFITDKDEPLFDICEVCYWQYDPVAHEKPDTIIGANSVSLNQAKINYKEYGASNLRFISYVRKPHWEESPENNKV